MSSVADEDYEHWPSDDKLWQEKAAPAAGYDSNNGLQRHAYLPAKSPSPPKAETAPAPPAPVPAPIGYPQPFYYPHGFPPQYHAYPPQGYQPIYHAPPHGAYYTYAAPPPAGAAKSVAATEKEKPKEEKPKDEKPANVFVYHPSYSAEPKMPQANPYFGRTKKEVAEDAMKLAKQEGASEKRKVAPIAGEDQLFWVMYDSGEPELRTYRDIKEMVGSWEKDPRNDSYFFLVDKEDSKKK